jgi:lysophospholipase L1-like esterase
MEAAAAEAGTAADVLTRTPLRLVTLGDSYTRGLRVTRRDTWPQQLVRALADDLPLVLAANLAETQTGSQQVIDEQLRQLTSYRPDVVSLQVGVNDVIAADVSLDDYRANVAKILDALVAELSPDRIFVITTPDYTLTRHGGDYGDRASVRAAIAEANAIITVAAEARGIVVVDISPVSDRVTEDRTLVVDGLHPSGKQYAGWVELIAPRMLSALGG